MLEVIEPPTRGRNNWLQREHARNDHTQCGEDGMLEKIFEILGVEKGNCVELGAYDGKFMSNTRRLITEKGWSAVMIEADDGRFAQLKECYADRDDVQCLHTLVHYEGEDTLDKIFARSGLPIDFDFFSLDVDGNDYHLWDSLKTYRPKVMVVEYNPSITNEIVFVQKRSPKVSQGCSLAALIKLGKEKGYELVATTKLNGFFVRKEDFHLFNIDDNSIDAMCTQHGASTYVFQLYDGTVELTGQKGMIWQPRLRMRRRDIQVLPRPLRFLSPPSRLRKYSKRLWIWLHRRRLV